MEVPTQLPTMVACGAQAKGSNGFTRESSALEKDVEGHLNS